MIWLQDFIKYLRNRFKDVEIIYIFGNHEYRLDRFVMEHCPAFWNFLKLENMLQLDQCNIKWLPYNERYKIVEGFYVQHSPPSYSKTLASTSLAHKIDESYIWNCAHRTDAAYRTGSSGKLYKAIINGWFGCRGIIEENCNKMPENRRVFMFTKGHETWNRSATLLRVSEKINLAIPTQVIIEKIGKQYFAAVGDTIYQG